MHSPISDPWTWIMIDFDFHEHVKRHLGHVWDDAKSQGLPKYPMECFWPFLFVSR